MAKPKQKNSTNWLHITITVIVVVWFAMILAVQLYRGRGSPPVRYDNGGLLSEDAKQKILQDLVAQEKSTLTKTQKEKMVQVVEKSSKNNLTVEQKQQLLDSLTK